MAEPMNRMRVEEVDWLTLLPWLRLFRSFRMAMHPPKLLLALLLVVLIFVGGRLLDAIFGPRAFVGEVAAYAALSEPEFAAWRLHRRQEVRQRLADTVGMIGASGMGSAIEQVADPFDAARTHVNRHFNQLQADLAARRLELSSSLDQLDEQRRSYEQQRLSALQAIAAFEPRGVFDTALSFQVDAFGRLVRSTAALRFGFGGMLRGAPRDSNTAAGALYDMAVVTPAWMFRDHRWFMLLFMAGALVVWSILGGGIARIAATQATRGEPARATEAVRFVLSRAGWFIFTPLLPLILAGILCAMLSAGGFVFFNWPGMDILGGFIFAAALLVGFLTVMLLLLLAGAGHLLYPALAVEGSDAFDAVSRAFSYLWNRPWHWLFYTLVSLIYGAVTYLFIGAIVFLTLLVTQWFVQIGVIRQTQDGVNRFEAILPAPRFGQLTHHMDWSQTALPLTAKIASGFVWVWVFLLVGLLAAFAVSFYFSVHTWIYLLLRRATDGTEYDDVFAGDEVGQFAAGAEPTVASKVEPDNASA